MANYHDKTAFQHAVDNLMLQPPLKATFYFFLAGVCFGAVAEATDWVVKAFI